MGVSRELPRLREVRTLPGGQDVRGVREVKSVVPTGLNSSGARLSPHP